MTRPFAAIAALCATVVAGAANAGGIAPAVTPPAPVVVVTPTSPWTGVFAGFNLGYGAGTYAQGIHSLGQNGPDVDVDGMLGAYRVGYNFQRGNQVYGFDLDVGNGPSGKTARGTAGPFWSCNTGDCNVSIDSLVTLRGRFGTLVTPSTLIYGAAGLAAAKYDGGIYNSVQQGGKERAFGYTVGLGAERMFAPRWSAYGEVNYVNLGDLTFGTDGAGNDYKGYGDFGTVKIGVNFHF